MPERKPAKKGTRESAKSTTAGKTKGFTDDERAAMKERARELKAARSGKADGESDVLAAIAKMPGSDRALAKRFHTIIKAGTFDNVIRLLPPLTIDEALLDEGLGLLDEAIAAG